MVEQAIATQVIRDKCLVQVSVKPYSLQYLSQISDGEEVDAQEAGYNIFELDEYNNTNNYDRRDFDTRSRKSQALSGVTVNFIPHFIPNVPADHFAVGIGIWASIDFLNIIFDNEFLICNLVIKLQ